MIAPSHVAHPSFGGYWLRFMLPWLLLVPILTTLLYQKRHEDAMAPLYQEANTLLADAAKTIAYHLGNIRRDALFLAKYQTLLDAAAGSVQDLTQVEHFFESFSAASQNYDQVRWLDNDAFEKVRVNLIQGHPQVVAKPLLQSKADRYYSIQSLSLPPDNFYISPLDLNVEKGKIETPIKPVLRVTTPVFLPSGERQGFIALNFLAQSMLDAIAKITANSNTELSLLNKEGYWLLSPNLELTWGFMFNRPDLTLAKLNPDAWQQITQHGEGAFITPEGLWDYETVQDATNTSDQDWKLVIRIPNTQLSKINRRSLLEALSLGVLLLLLGGGICWRAAKSMRERDNLNQELTAQQQKLTQSNTALAESLQHLHDTQKQLIETGKLSSLGMMVAGVAHELNTPVGAAQVTLSSMINECTKLQTAFETGLKRSDVDTYFLHFHEGADIVQANLSRAATLVSSFKRLAVDRTREERRNFKLTSLVQDMLHTSWLRMKKQSHELEIDIAPNIELNSYPGALGQSLENLVTNAITHAFESAVNGQIKISAQMVKDQMVEITISDNGTGMSEETMKQIFNPFFTTRRGNGGTGLGLHLTYQLVSQLLGGKITVSSTLGKGSVFCLTIPVIAPEAAELNLN